MKTLFILLLIVSIQFNNLFSQNEEKLIKIKTELGDIVIKLYNETPKHRDNILKLVEEKFYDGILFHRVIDNFMIQTGDPDSKNAKSGAMLGNGGPGYLVDAEFIPNLIHKKGALAAARQGDNVNPEKKSSSSQFYIVEGQIYTEEMLNKFELQMKYNQKKQVFADFMNNPENKIIKHRFDSLKKSNIIHQLNDLTKQISEKLKDKYEAIDAQHIFTPEQRKIYTTIGGTPHLDGGYTVFGEVIKGFDILDQISKLEVDKYNRPLKDISIITIELIK